MYNVNDKSSEQTFSLEGKVHDALLGILMFFLI